MGCITSLSIDIEYAIEIVMPTVCRHHLESKSVKSKVFRLIYGLEPITNERRGTARQMIQIPVSTPGKLPGLAHTPLHT